MTRVAARRGEESGTWGFGCGKQGWEGPQAREDLVEEAAVAARWLRVVGVEAREGGRWGGPYSRSLAGVGGRLEGVSEWRVCWEGVGVMAVGGW